MTGPLRRAAVMPLVIVARASLGTINHTLLTLEAAAARQLQVVGVILSQAIPPDPTDLSVETNAAELACRTTVPILAVLPHAPAADLLRDPAFRRMDFLGLSTDRRASEGA